MDTKIVKLVKSAVLQNYYFGGERSQEQHFYHIKSKVVTYAEDGKQTGIDVFKLHLMCEPGDRSVGESDKYTCTRFSLQRDGEPEVTIPALKGWSYNFNRRDLNEFMLDKQGQLFSISNVKFESLTDNTGITLPPEVGYQVYSMFIYYHSYCTGLVEPVEQGKGIQDLKRIGDRVILESSGIETPIPGGMGEEGSTFKHGDETLEFKGLSVIDDSPCAIIGFDSGEGSFTMIMKPMPNIEVKTVGRSHYLGDIYLDLESKWVKKVTKILVDITKTTMSGKKIATSIIETSLTIKTILKDEFSQD
jgi:hypothetical protein